MLDYMGEFDITLMKYVADNGGVVTRSEVIALGLSPRTLSRRVATGQLVSAARGVFVLPGVSWDERAQLRAATARLDAVASHESAARLHGVDGLDPRRVAVSVPVRKSNRFLGVIVHQLTDLEESEIVILDGIPTTDPTRMIIELAAVLPANLLASVTDQVVRMRLTTYRRIADRLESLARRGKPGVRKLRTVLEPRLGGAHTSDSELETRLFELLRTSGIPVPVTQFRPPWLRHMNGRVDIAFESNRLIVEGDSQRWHGSPEAFQGDRRRDNLAQLAGWRILRFTWEDITQRPEYVWLRR
jgi:very-short-patch-repair endonuclease